MTNPILREDVQDFIKEHFRDDLPTIALNGPYFDDIDTKVLLDQMSSKLKCENKLPTWFNTEGILYPPKLSIEQSSSEITAHFKSSLIKGKSLIDLTGGYGVDTYYLAQSIAQVTHCEIDLELSQIAKHNFIQLGQYNINTYCVDGIELVSHLPEKADWVYLDPARRSQTKKRVFKLEDCTPNILKNIDLLFKHTKNIMLKTAPFLDISLGIKQLKQVEAIYVVAVNNEVKELLWLLRSNVNKLPQIHAVNLTENSVWSHSETWPIQSKSIETSEVQRFLYEPLASALKASIHHNISSPLGLFKIHPQTHLYTSNQFVEFPGQTYRVLQVEAYNLKGFKAMTLSQANFKVRNAPDRTEIIRKKFKFKDGGKYYLFFTTDHSGKGCIIKTIKVDFNALAFHPCN